MNRSFCCCISALSAACAVAHAEVSIQLNPRGTFLRISQETAFDPAIRTLQSMGVAPGDYIRIRVTGEYTFNTANAVTSSTNAVFSSSSTLLAPTLINRVPGAIDAGADIITGGTFRGGLPTDIPEDFLVNTATTPNLVRVVVPAGAEYLFIGPADSLYEDNLDTDNDYFVHIAVICSAGDCCNADFNNDGDTGTDADIEAFFACLAGNCCTTCATADFNADGDTGTDADIEAFFRVLAGGNC